MAKTSPCTPAADYRTDAPREDGWTHDRQALFLLTLAQTGIVSTACKAVEMSEGSAYMLRRERRGALFALGWKAAHLMARDLLADQVMKIARCGVESVVTKADGITHRTTLSTGPIMLVLNRLDRQADSLDDKEMAIIRRLCVAFDDFIEIILAGGNSHDFLAFLKRTPDPLRQPLAQIMQMEAEEPVYEMEAVAAEDAAEAAPAAPAAPSAARQTRRAIDPIVVEESAIFAAAPAPARAAGLAAIAALAKRGVSGVAMAA